MHPDQIKIFAGKDSPRLRYIAGIILGDILGLDWNIITDEKDIDNVPLINYSSKTIPGSFKIDPSPLLSETGISQTEISVSHWKGLPVFFESKQDQDIPFDIFASSFYMVSRYEEYQDFIPDRHGRFAASLSLAFKKDFLNIPVVDLWAWELAAELEKKYSHLAFSFSNYDALLTIDSDQPFAYLGKGMIRSVGGFFKDLISGVPAKALERFRVLTHKENDPFEVYDYITGNIAENNTMAKFFFPVGRYSEYDKNPAWTNARYRSLMKKLGERYITGLHPSYYASDNVRKFRMEREWLSSIMGREIFLSRFHFIRMKIPGSYKMLAAEGITEDYSMGYPDQPGFRAGIARPYLFYDLTEEKQTSLKLVPFQVMDATLVQYMNLDPQGAEELIIKLINVTKKAGGLFVSLWHNTTLLNTPEWKGWRTLFEKVLDMQKP